MKTFKFLNQTFQPLRNLTEGELSSIGFKLNSIGISNYKDKSQLTHISDKWNYVTFYERANDNSDVVDIYLMNGKIKVIPCKNELFELLD